MFDRDAFEQDKVNNAISQSQNKPLQKMAIDFIVETDKQGYGYQWTWLGLPIIQMPEDIVAVQEVIWKCKPTLIIETGIAWGGSVILYASIMELIGKGRVVAIDKVLPDKNRDAIAAYPFSSRISLIEGSSLDVDVHSQVQSLIRKDDTVMVMLDSNHTHEHVLEELRLYGPYVSRDQYLVVSDTVVERIPEQKHRKRPWGPGDNPETALASFLEEDGRFERDTNVNNKLLATFTPGGYVRRVR